MVLFLCSLNIKGLFVFKVVLEQNGFFRKNLQLPKVLQFNF